MLNKYCSYDIHTNNKINIKHNTDILLKIRKSCTKCIISYDIIIIIFILLLCITIILVIHNHIHETKHISEVYDVAAILLFQFMTYWIFFFKKILYFYIRAFLSMCSVTIWLFALIPWFHGFPVLCSGNLWMILNWFLLPQLLLLSLLLLHSTCTVLLL